MEKVDGIDLEALVNEANKERLLETSQKIMQQVRGIKNDIDNWTRSIKKAEQEIAKCDQKIKNANESLAKIAGGDWGPLKEDKPDVAQQ